MSKIVSPKLLIDGSDFLPQSSYSVNISQAMGSHSSFRISFPTSATEGYGGLLMDNALQSVGKKISIGLDDGALEFVGIITSVDLQKQNGAPGTLVLSGYSSSILLSKSVQCLSYEEGTSLSQVLSDTFEGHGELLKTATGEGTDVKLPYTVQYNEDDFSFVRRLCSRYGIWFYDNGANFNVGRSGQAQLAGVYGETIQTFQLSANLQGRSFGVKSHDWVNDTPLEADTAAFSPQSGHPYIDTVNSTSESVFAKKGNYDWALDQNEYSGQQGVDNATKIATLARTATMITASGTSEITELRVGDSLNIEGLKFADNTQKETYGAYMITRITHQFDHSGHYTNQFEGVPEGTQHPNYGNIFSAPFSQSQRGLVLDNSDPNGLGRVKVQFGWQKPMGTTTPWIKMHTPYSGADKGFYMIPELNEEVLVGFEGGNAEKPFVLSAGYSNSASSGMADADNNIKAIKTRSGHLIEFNDTDGGESITIKDKNENIININTTSNNIMISAHNDITINAAENLLLNSKNMQINVEENLDITVGKNKIESINEDYTLMANNEEHQIGEDIKVISSSYKQEAQEITIDASGEIKTNAGGKITIASAESIEYGE